MADDDREGLSLLITSTGVVALVFPTALQVMWLIAAAVAVVAAGRVRGRDRPEP